MDYQKVIAVLLNQEQFGEAELSAALNVPLTRMLQPFMSEGSDGYAEPPDGWRDALANLVEEKATAYQVDKFLKSLASEAESSPRVSDIQPEKKDRAEHLYTLARIIRDAD